MSYGLIGLGSMGSNLALNISRKTHLHLYNRSYSKVDSTVAKGKTGSMKGHQTILQMTQSMSAPRTIITMLPHGTPSHDTIAHTLNLLEPGDTIIDCANEHYMTSIERQQLCDSFAVNYLGVGMSGGVKGAYNGPAVMVGGRNQIYKQQYDYLTSFCNNVVHIKDVADSGHFTKMVHNGIEYAMLQAIGDVYAYVNYDDELMSALLRRCCNDDSLLKGYLVNSAFNVIDNYDISKISDIAEMNNTGLWCVEYAYQHGLSVPIMHSAVQSRIASKYEKQGASQRRNTQIDLDAAYNALCLVFAMAMMEGIMLIEEKYIDVNKAQLAWSKHTIIECPLVTKSTSQLEKITDQSIHKARLVLLECVRNGVPVPSVSAAVQQHDFSHQLKTQMSMVMAQRNYFGQHAFKVD